MINFEEALKTGLAFAEEESRNLEEIDSVFDLLQDSIKSFTDNSVSIELQEMSTLREGNYQGALSVLNAPKMVNYTGLMAYNLNGQKTYYEQLCEWKIGEKGYPVTLDYTNKSVACADKESLIKALQILLMRPETGKKIKFLTGKAQE